MERVSRLLLAVCLVLAAILYGCGPVVTVTNDPQPLSSLKPFADGTATEADWETLVSNSNTEVGGVPDYYVAYAAALLYSGADDLENADPHDVLGVFALVRHEAVIQANRTLAAEEGLPESFIEDLDRTIAWGKSMRENPRAAYEASKSYFAGMGNRTIDEIREAVHAGQLDDGSYMKASLAHTLASVAIELNLPEARYDKTQRELRHPDPYERSWGRWDLRELAGDGYLPAILDIANRYVEGRDFEKSDIKAYYWFLEARYLGAGVDDRIRELSKHLTPDNLFELRTRFEDAMVPLP